MQRSARLLAAFALIGLLGASSAYAQATAQITGVVSDTQGAVLPGVDVTAVRTETSLKRSQFRQTRPLCEIRAAACLSMLIGPFVNYTRM